MLSEIKLRKLIQELISEDARVRNFRGYGAVHPMYVKAQKQSLGDISYKEKEYSQEDLELVKISKAFLPEDD
jgi:hypothetical protein